MAFDREAEDEQARLEAAITSYGDACAPFDALMRGLMMREFSPLFADGPALQIGCAHGDQASLLADRFPDLTVLEPVAAFLDQTRAWLGARARYAGAMLEDFETERRFQTILFSHVLEHVADPIAALRKLAGLLAPGGRLFVVVPNAEAPSRRIAVKMGVLARLESLSPDDVAAGHRRVYRLDTLLGDVREAGLAVEASGGIFFKPLANFQLNVLMGGPLIGDAFLEGCYALGRERPTDCASIYAVVRASETGGA